jgi:hypothetical protein
MRQLAYQGFSADDAYAHLNEPPDQQPVVFSVPSRRQG